MSKKTCFLIFVAAVIIIALSFIFKIAEVTVPVNLLFGSMKNPYIAGSAVVLALLFNKQRHYWLIMIACALLAAIVVQMLIAGGTFEVYAIMYKALAFLVYVYLIMLIRFMI
ncbi:MAG: hypothetical protein SO141_00025 [Alphaproteobacteria bacterium]|nr:hypothetical protein [Alphaproteobacteria bacterium]